LFRKRLLSAAIIALSIAYNLYSQMSFDFEVALEGQSSQIEGNMIRDEEGFLWFCYYGGVARYDGYEVRHYVPGDNSLSGPATISIAMDYNGNIWILTKDNGLNRYNKDTDEFTQFSHDPGNENSISNNLSDSFGPHRLFVDHNNRLLLGTMSGFDIYDIGEDRFYHYIHDPGNPNSLSSNNVTAVLEDSRGIIWVGTGGDGLNRFDESTNTWTRFSYDAESDMGPASDTIWSLLEDSRGAIWIGTWNGGLSRFDHETETFNHYRSDPDNPYGLGDNKIFSLYEDLAGNIYICHRDSDVAGFEVYDRESDGFLKFVSSDSNSSSISSNYISSVYEDPVTGILWALNTHNGTIDKFDKKSKKFSLEQPDPKDPHSISSSLIVVMLEDINGNLWISTGDSLNLYDKKTKRFSSYSYMDIDPAMGTFTSAMCWENDNQMWLLSNRGVLTLFDIPTLKPVRQYKHNPEDENSIMVSTSAGGHIIKDNENENILWIGLSSGLEKFNIETETFTHYTYMPYSTSISQGTVWSVYDDGEGSLWISAFGGLSILEKATESFTSYIPDPELPDSIGFTKQSRVFEDSFGNFWIAGFENGMDLFDRETGVFEHFNKETGFPATGINLTIQEDSSGHLWIGTTDNGLIKFNIEKKEVVSVFSKDDGLQDNHFWRSFKMSDGQMWFGGGFGVNHFYPEQVTLNKTIVPVYLTSFTQSGKKLNLGIAPERLKEVTLGWQENYFEFQFTALNYTKPEKNRFAYMLEGRDRQWYYSDENPSGRYTGLNGGSYTLRLKAANNDGLWNEDGYSLQIEVIPPFWRTKVFYILAFLVLSAIIYLVIFYVRKLHDEIRERKSSDNKLQNMQSYLSNIIDSMPSILIAVDNSGYIIQWNKTAVKKTNISSKKAYGKYLTTALPFLEQRREIIDRSIHSKEVNHIPRIDRKVGSEIIFEEIIVYPLAAEGMEGAVIRIDDVSEKVRMEEMMIQSEKIHSIGGLASGMAHEINNPLAGMIQTANVMSKRLGSRIDMTANVKVAEEVGIPVESIRLFMEKRGILRMIDSINESGNRVAQIVHNMLSFARKSEGRLSSHQLTSIVDKTIILASNDFDIQKNHDFKKISIRKEYEINLPEIICDESKIQQVILNILQNGAQAMDDAETENPQFTVRLKMGKGDTKICMSFEDNGPGMKENVRKRVFDPFFTTKSPVSGTGLGLSVAYYIVTVNHDGEMYVESEPGKGTTFTILLPIRSNP